MASSSRKSTVMMVAAVVMLVAAGVLLWARGIAGSGNPDFPDGHPFICADCGHTTILSNDELLDLKVLARESHDPDAGRVLCSECGSANMVPAIKCPNCGEYFPRPEGRPVCPHCKKPFPSLFKDE